MANRDRPGAEGVVGYLSNMLVLRNRLRGNPTFRDALATTRVCDAIIASGRSGAWQTL